MRHPCVGVLVAACVLHRTLAGTAYLQAPAGMREFSCEAFPRETGEAELVGRYGRGNVRRAGIFGWDDGPQDGAVVFPDRPELKLEIIWAEPGKTIGSIRAVGGRWQSPSGISVGMDLKTIERRNGWPFRLAAFAREGYPGEVLSWGNGRFKTKHAGSCNVYIYLLPIEGQPIDPAVRRQLNVREFSSGHPAIQAINPHVYQMLIWYR